MILLHPTSFGHTMSSRPITLTQTSYFHGRQLDTVKDAKIARTITSPCFSNVLCYALPECVIRGSASVHRFFFPRCTVSRSACCRFIHTGIKQGCLLYYPSLCLVLCMDMPYNSCFLPPPSSAAMAAFLWSSNSTVMGKFHSWPDS